MIKEKLMDALKVAAASYNGGMSANAAVAKAAEAADFNEKQAERLVEMFNTLAALNKEKDVGDPTGSCELAEKSAVSKLLLDGCGDEKKASAEDYSCAYSFYSGNPVRTNGMLEARSSGRSSMLKAASAVTEHIPDELNVSQRSLYKIISEKIASVKATADAADDVARNLRLYAKECVIKIAKAIESPFAAPGTADMFKAACQNGDVVKMVSEYSTKVAESDGGGYAKMQVFDSEPVDELLKIAESAGHSLGSVAEYERKRDVFREKAAAADAEMIEAVGIKTSSVENRSLSDFFVGVGSRNLGAELCARTSSDDALDDAKMCTKIAQLIRDADVDSAEVSRLAEDFEKEAAPKVFWQVTPPSASEAHDALVKKPGIDSERKRMLNVRRSILLADLMANDPIIRDADPNMVAEAYKTIVMSAPRVSLDKAQVRSFLRNAVNSVAISPNDAKVLTDVDKGISRSAVDAISSLTSRDSSIKDSNKEH